MPFVYQTGEQIKPGDRVLLHGGGGVMVAEPKVFGHLFIDAPVSDYADLEFVSRRPDPSL